MSEDTVSKRTRGANRSGKSRGLLILCAAVIVIAVACWLGRRHPVSTETADHDVRMPDEIALFSTVEGTDPQGSVAESRERDEAPGAPSGVSVRSEGSFPVEYIDGPIILLDGFEKGSGNWGARILRGEDGRMKLDESATVGEESLRIEERDVRGTPSRVVVFEFRGEEKKSCIALVPAEMPDVDAFSFTLDVWLYRGTVLHYMVNPPGRTEVVYCVAGDQSPTERWESVRVTVVPRRDAQSQDFFETSFFIDGKLVLRQRVYSERVIPGCILSSGRVLIDNVVIRQLMPDHEAGP